MDLQCTFLRRAMLVCSAALSPINTATTAFCIFCQKREPHSLNYFFFFLFVSIFLSKAFNQVAEVEKKGGGGRELDYILSTQRSCE